MLKIENEQLLTLAEAARRLPNRPHLSTLARWISRGVRGRKLTPTIVGGRRYVSERSLDEFIAALNEQRAAGTPIATMSRSRTSRIEKAYRDLSREKV